MDQRLFAPTRSLSQRTTSFIASYRQGIHQMPFGHLITLISNAHRDHSPGCCLGETQLLAVTIRLGAHCTERPEVIQDIPDPIPRLREKPEILHIDRLRNRCSWKTPTSTSVLRHIPSLRCQMRDALASRGHLRAEPAMERMLSSHGCIFGGAGRDRTDDLKLAKLPLSQLSYGPDPIGADSHGNSSTKTQHKRMWWAWEDLNFRPHAYQARALTN